jgi:hypothetical protein
MTNENSFCVQSCPNNFTGSPTDNRQTSPKKQLYEITYQTCKHKADFYVAFFMSITLNQYCILSIQTELVIRTLIFDRSCDPIFLSGNVIQYFCQVMWSGILSGCVIWYFDRLYDPVFLSGYVIRYFWQVMWSGIFVRLCDPVFLSGYMIRYFCQVMWSCIFVRLRDPVFLSGYLIRYFCQVMWSGIFDRLCATVFLTINEVQFFHSSCV